MSLIAKENQRQFYRLTLDPPLCSDMTIVQIKGKSLETGDARVLIEDLGPGGLRFLSTLSLIKSTQVVLEFKTEVMGEFLKMHGYIVRAAELTDEIMEYGVQFTMGEEEMAQISRLINRLAIRLRQNRNLPSGRFLTGDRLTFLKAEKDEF